jgi:hypothetical protein
LSACKNVETALNKQISEIKVNNEKEKASLIEGEVEDAINSVSLTKANEDELKKIKAEC